jgi:hypothetical protein
VSTDAQVEALKALIATATKAPCLDHDEAQALATKPASYTILYVSRRFGGNVRGGTRENPLRRAQVRVNAKSVTNARLIEDRTAELFEHATHDLAGALVHLDFETQDAALELDTGGYYSRLTDYTFAV